MKRIKLLVIIAGLLVMISSICMCYACSTKKTQSTKATVCFDLNTDYKTNVIRNQTLDIGKKVKKPNAFITVDNPENLEVYGWYTDKEYTKQWDFKKDVVAGDMTLYAKWIKKCTVNYFVGEELVETYNVFSGSTVREYPEYALGYEYEGSYADNVYSKPFDFSTPVLTDTNIYMKRSAGIYISEEPREGRVSTGKLSDVLEALLGSVNSITEANGDEAGYVEPYTLANGEMCAYVNFGYTPTYGDGYVELALNLDITASQKIVVTYKNLGNCKTVCAFFTTLIDLKNETYSLTGAEYTQKYCYPNYEGASVGPIELQPNQINMGENDEWQTLELDLKSIYTNGYSVWGTSKFLGKLRIQANYLSDKNNPNDYSNAFLIKSIEGVYDDVQVNDSEEIGLKLTNSTEAALQAKRNEQAANDGGMVFPLNADYYNCEKSRRAGVYDTVDGLLIHTDNEIALRDQEDKESTIVFDIPKEKKINLDELTTFNIRLTNFGYSKSLTVLLYNDLGSRLLSTIAIDDQMSAGKTFTYNFYKKTGMTGNLIKVELRYTPVGVDNALLISDLYLSEYKPFDIVGISFNDKKSYGLKSTNDVDVSFDGARAGTLFAVKNGGAEVDTECSATTTCDGYYGQTINYILPAKSDITAIEVGYLIDGEYVTYTHALDVKNKGNKTLKSFVAFDLSKRGKISKLKLKFIGTGNVLIKNIAFEIGENTIDFSSSFETLYRLRHEWLNNASYSLDEVRDASVFTNKAQSLMSLSLYIGYSAMHYSDNIPYSFKNIKIEESKKTKVKIIYQNRTEKSTLNFIGGFDYTDYGVADTANIGWLEKYLIPIDNCMKEYEWSCLTIEIPDEYVNKFFAKIVIQFEGEELSIRAIAIEKE